MVFVFDAGTSAIKAGAFSDNGTLLCSFTEQTPFSSPKKRFESLCTCARRLSLATGETEVSIVIDGNGPTLITYPETDALFWSDRRAVSQAERVSALKGFPVDAAFVLPKVLRIKEEEPELYKKTKYFFDTQDYLNFRLTGVPTASKPLEMLERWYWDGNTLKTLELDEYKFPPYVEIGGFVGNLTKEAAQLTGLSQKSRVYGGCPDFIPCILGTASVKTGIICDRCGTSEGINYCGDKPDFNPALMCYRHPDGIHWNISGSINTTGEAANKMAGLLEIGSGGDFTSCAKKAPVLSNGLLFAPYLMGERAPIRDPDLRGALIGVSNLSSQEDIARAVIEGACFAIRHVIETIGGKPLEIRAVGKPAKDPFWNAVKADVTGLCVKTIDCEEPELLGLFAIAMKAQGKIAAFSDISSLVRIKETFEPDLKNHRLYTEAFEQYKKLAPIILSLRG